MATKKQTEDGKMRWHFPILDHGESDGLSDPLLQYFEGDYERHIAREIIQNSIDACAETSQPVCVAFEKMAVSTSDVPGADELKNRIRLCLELARVKKKQKAEVHFSRALKAISADEIDILRVRDFNTTGLTGDDDDDDGKWHRLVKAVGENELSGVGGGSFGIGKGAPFAASILRTVYYSTINVGGESIFQGKTRLISHEWEGQKRKGVGFYGVNGYESVREQKLIPGFFRRDKQGTDISIIGYDASADWQSAIAKSVLANFWAAIYSGALEVSIGSGKYAVPIRADNLHEMLEKYSRDEALPYFKAVIAPTNYTEKSLPLLGNCKLYIRKEEGFPKDIALMRKPKMVVEKKPYRILQDAYAGVFMCDNDEGNKLLRGLEPPEHDEWNENRDKVLGRKLIREKNEWIKSVLREMASAESGDPEDIPDLDKFLPYDDESERDIEHSHKGNQPAGTAGKEESGHEVGAEREEKPEEVEGYIRRPTTTREGAGSSISHGTHDTVGGGGDVTHGGGDSDGKSFSRIDTSTIQFRAISAGVERGKAEYCLVIASETDQEGSVNVVAVGDDASYPVPLGYAEPWKGGKKYRVRGSYIDGLKLSKGEQIRIRLGLNTGARYALGIEKYEG